jgi:hypothetical protein
MITKSDIETYAALRTRADRIRAMIHRRAVQAYGRAFGSETAENLDMCVIHNSLISFDDGKPWCEINYSEMRKAAWLCERSFEPGRICTAFYQRKSRS